MAIVTGCNTQMTWQPVKSGIKCAAVKNLNFEILRYEAGSIMVVNRNEEKKKDMGYRTAESKYLKTMK